MKCAPENKWMDIYYNQLNYKQLLVLSLSYPLLKNHPKPFNPKI